MRPTYVKVPVQTVDQLKFWEATTSRDEDGAPGGEAADFG